MQRFPPWLSALLRYRWLVPGLLVLYLLLPPSVASPDKVDFLLLLFVIGAALAWQLFGGAVAALVAVIAYAVRVALSGQVPAPLPMVEGLLFHMTIAAVVGHLARREQELAQRTAQLIRAQERLAAIHEIAGAVSSTLDFRDALRVCHQRCKELFGLEYLAILWRNPETGDLQVEWAEGFLVPLGTVLKRGEGISGWVAEHDTPVIVGDVEADPRYIPGLPGAKSQASVPMRLQGQVVGVLTVESTRPNAFTQEDLQVLSSIADHLAAALANARLHQQVREMAITDATTNLYNHRHFQEVLRSTVARRGDSPVALVLFDLDHFKLINDTHGHPAGDAVLKQVADTLRSCCRRSDILCRYGGEEFALILPGADVHTATAVAERMRQRIQSLRMLLPDGSKLAWPVTLSAGIAVCPEDAEGPVDLLVQADRALYAAKTAGRNRIAYPRDADAAQVASS